MCGDLKHFLICNGDLLKSNSRIALGCLSVQQSVYPGTLGLIVTGLHLYTTSGVLLTFRTSTRLSGGLHDNVIVWYWIYLLSISCYSIHLTMNRFDSLWSTDVLFIVYLNPWAIFGVINHRKFKYALCRHPFKVSVISCIQYVMFVCRPVSVCPVTSDFWPMWQTYH